MKKQKIVIIGAGSTGLSVALELAKSGKAEVIVLEKDFVGSGQTGQCCGFVRTFYNAKEMIISASYSMQQIKSICQQSADLEYEKMGLLVFDQLKNKLAIKRNVNLLKSLGVKARYLEGEQVKKINPCLNVDSVCAGFDEEAGYINPESAVCYLKAECQKAGVTIVEQAKVISIERSGKHFIVSTKDKSFNADKLFNATAGYTNNINKMLGFSLPVKTIRINNTFYRLPSGPAGNLTAIADFKNCFYCIPHRDFIDVSSMALDLKQIIDLEQEIAGFDGQTIEENKKIIARRIEGAERSASLGGFGSHIDVSPDYYPILSRIDEMPNYFCAAGFSGTGFKHFPMIGKIMRALILEEDFEFNELISFFRYDRFKSDGRRESVSDSYFVNEPRSSSPLAVPSGTDL